jgi:hypothetical protein
MPENPKVPLLARTFNMDFVDSNPQLGGLAWRVVWAMVGPQPSLTQ